MPTGIRIRGNRCQMRLKRPGRGWDWEATGLLANQVAAATKLRTATQALIDTGDVGSGGARTTVAAYAKRWISDRRGRGVRTVSDDETRLKLHVLGCELATNRAFGQLFIDDVRPIHCRAIIRAAIAKGLASRTVRNVSSAAASMFADAVADELLASTPWVIPRREMPRKRDADPAWRALAKFSLEEIRRLLWAPVDVVPWDRRTLYALMYFGALRFGEASALRWGDILDGERLPALHVHGQYSTERKTEDETKTESVRLMPVHPELATLLGAWRSDGYREFFGDVPELGDLIVPSRRGRNRTSNHQLKKFKQDLRRLGMRARRQHDLRRSLIGHAVDAGASRERLRPGTHGIGTTVLELYDSPEWTACCDQVLKLVVQIPAAAVVAKAGGQVMGTFWGGEAGMPQNSLSGSNKWRGGRDSKPRDRAQTVTVGRSNSAGVAGGGRRGSGHLRSIAGAGVPILPMAEARALLEACGGDLATAVEALRATVGKRSLR